MFPYDGGVSGMFDKDRMLKHTHLQDAHNHIQELHNHGQNPHKHNLTTFDGGTNNMAARPYRTGENSTIKATSNESISEFTATNIEKVAINKPETAVNQYSGDGDYNKPPSLSSVAYLSY